MEGFMGNVLGGLQPQQPQQRAQQSYPSQEQWGGKGGGRPPRKDISQIQCFKCHEFGHYANTCQSCQPPQQQQMMPYAQGGAPQMVHPQQQQQMVTTPMGMVTPQAPVAQTAVVTQAELATLAKIDALQKRMDVQDTDVAALKMTSENALIHLGNGLEAQADTLNNTVSHMDVLTRKVSTSANDNALAASISKEAAAHVKSVRNELTLEHSQRLLAQKKNYEALMKEIHSVDGRMNWAKECIQMQALTLKSFRQTLSDFKEQVGDSSVDTTSTSERVTQPVPEPVLASDDDEVQIVEKPSTSAATPATCPGKRRKIEASPAATRPSSARAASKKNRVPDEDEKEMSE